MNNLPVGVLDSGIGGASVLKAIVELMPKEKYIFLIDNKNMPYGNKLKFKLKAIVKKNITFLIKKYNIKMLVLACNTATSICADFLRDNFKIPIICVEPPIKPAIETQDKKILVLGTKNTLKNNKTIKNAISKVKKKNKNLFSKNKIKIKKLIIKDLARKIDENFKNLDNIQDLLNKKLNNYKNYDSLVIGCTHYNFIKNQIQKCLPKIKIISCEKAVANRAKFILERDNIKINLQEKQKIKIILTKPNLKLKNFVENYLK